MLRSIPESDWKAFRELHRVARDRFCNRVLTEIERLVSDASRTGHERYLAVLKLIEDRDRELADAFDDLRRSTALLQLAHIHSNGLLMQEEMNRFTPETRGIVQFLLNGPGA